MADTVKISQFQIDDYKNFTYLITCGGESLVIDPQKDLKPWLEILRQEKATLKGVLLTHSHWDHVIGLPQVEETFHETEYKIYIHKHEAMRLKNSPQQITMRFSFIEEGSRLRLGTCDVQVMHTPGHSRGECSFYIDSTPGHLFTGDTVFVGNVGRTDLESGSTKEMFESLQRIKKLSPDTILYPGHDYGRTPTSTVARESRESAAFLCQNVEELDAVP